MPLLIMIVLVIVTFLFGDSILTPILIVLGKKISLLLSKIQALLTKKNILQVLVQSLLLAGKALLRLINKTVTVWILPLLLTRRQRYWLHQALVDARTALRRRALRIWVRWRRRPRWFKVVTLVPMVLLAIALFVGSGILLAAVFGVTFIVPWIGGLPLATAVFFRKALARLGLFVLERLGFGAVVNKTVDWLIDLIWWRTPEPIQRRFDAWWRRFKMQLRRRVIGPRRHVVKRMERFRRWRSDRSDEALAGEAPPRAGADREGIAPSSRSPAKDNPLERGLSSHPDQASSADP